MLVNCVKCGTGMPPWAKFCMKCGQHLEASQLPPAQESASAALPGWQAPAGFSDAESKATPDAVDALRSALGGGSAQAPATAASMEAAPLSPPPPDRPEGNPKLAVAGIAAAVIALAGAAAIYLIHSTTPPAPGFTAKEAPRPKAAEPRADTPGPLSGTTPMAGTAPGQAPPGFGTVPGQAPGEQPAGAMPAAGQPTAAGPGQAPMFPSANPLPMNVPGGPVGAQPGGAPAMGATGNPPVLTGPGVQPSGTIQWAGKGPPPSSTGPLAAAPPGSLAREDPNARKGLPGPAPEEGAKQFPPKGTTAAKSARPGDPPINAGNVAPPPPPGAPPPRPAELSGAAPPAAPAPPPRTVAAAPGGAPSAPRASGQRLKAAQDQQCADAEFLSRFVCNERVRLRFCRDRWNEHPDCQLEGGQVRP